MLTYLKYITTFSTKSLSPVLSKTLKELSLSGLLSPSVGHFKTTTVFTGKAFIFYFQEYHLQRIFHRNEG